MTALISRSRTFAEEGRRIDGGMFARSAVGRAAFRLLVDAVAHLRPDDAHNAAFLRLTGVGKPHLLAAALFKIWTNTPGAQAREECQDWNEEDLACPQLSASSP